MKHLLQRAALISLVACTGPIEDKTTTGDTSTTNTGETGTDCPTPAPLFIDSLSVSCDDAKGVVRFEVGTSGVTGDDGLIFSQETASTFIPQFSDEHSLVSFDADPCGQFDTLEREILVGETLYKQVPDVSTVFSCAGHYDLGTSFMSYIVRVYDDVGTLADCWAVGHDPQAAVDDTIDRVIDPVDPGELASCNVQQGPY